MDETVGGPVGGSVGGDGPFPGTDGWRPSARTADLVGAAAQAWRRGLIDISGSNRRLFYVPLPVGTLQLGDADPEALDRLLAGHEVSLRSLVPDDGTPEGMARVAAAGKAAEKLAGSAKVGQEETGDNPVRLALGLATWTPVDDVESDPVGPRAGRRPAAPLLLVPVTLHQVAGSKRVRSLQLSGEPELNSSLRFVLAAQFDVTLPTEELLARAVDRDGGIEPGRLLDAARQLGQGVPGWQVSEHTVVHSFGSDAELMLRDLADVELLSTHPLLAAMAGDVAAQAAVRGAAPPEGSEEDEHALRALDELAPDLEHLVLDADASQQAVIAHALAGRSLVVQGPPGTGKSQTIANLVAEATAAGRSVLFVAQKRAAVDAVLKRLDAVGLSDWVLEVFDVSTRRGGVVKQIAAAMDGLGTATVPDVGALHRDLGAARDRLVAHDRALHSAHPDLAGRSPYDLLALIAEIPARAQTGQRLPSAVVAGWLPQLAELTQDLEQLCRLGGLDPDLPGRTGWDPQALSTDEAARAGYDAAATASGAWSPARQRLQDALRVATLPPSGPGSAGTLREAREVLRLLDDLGRTVAALDPTVWDEGQTSEDRLRELVGATGDRATRVTMGLQLGWWRRRTLRRQAAELVRDPSAAEDWAALHELLVTASRVRSAWAVGRDAGATPLPVLAGWDGWLPQLVAARRAASAAVVRLDDAVTALDPLTQHVAWDSLPWAELGAAVDSLLRDPLRGNLPRIHTARTHLEEAGAGPVLEALSERLRSGADVEPQLAADRLRYVALMSSWEHLEASVPALAEPSGHLGDVAATFRAADRAHVTANRDRVARAAAERAHQVLDAHPQQTLALRDQLKRKRSFKSLRQLVEDSPQALLALKPCWAMSPLLVSRYLPAVSGLFDLVVFDEASQVRIPDAVPSLLRGKQAVVAGDDKQLPPTMVFQKKLDSTDGDGPPVVTASRGGSAVAATNDDEDEQEVDEPDVELGGGGPSVSVASGYTSILESLGVLLPNRTLLWHYRSRDERLIAVSNNGVYRGRLTAFPGTAGAEVISHVVVPPSRGLGRTDKSPQGEVDTVCRLVMEHARAQLAKPEDQRESLGVIAMGREHADRIEKAVFTALETDPDRERIAPLFGEDAEEPYFVKNLERVQGDERDAIILTVGYGVGEPGRPRYLWGPLLDPQNGIKRLNVAISRSRSRMTLVSSFSADQLPADGSSSSGYQLMREFAVFAASRGEHLPTRSAPVPMNPFEEDVHDRLSAAGMRLDPQYGVSRYRLDFAVRHPDHDGSDGVVRHLLAIECDGRAWHSGFTARERDRLRQQHLEQLGWRFHRIWSTDWFRDPDREVELALTAWREATERSRAGLRPTPTEPDPIARWVGPAARPAAAPRRRPPSWVQAGAPINTYTDGQLVDLVRWVRADGILRLADDEIGELMEVLGFQRRGSSILARLTAAQQGASQV